MARGNSETPHGPCLIPIAKSCSASVLIMICSRATSFGCFRIIFYHPFSRKSFFFWEIAKSLSAKFSFASRRTSRTKLNLFSSFHLFCSHFTIFTTLERLLSFTDLVFLSSFASPSSERGRKRVKILTAMETFFEFSLFVYVLKECM